jgi:hypothetical protein
LKMGGKAALTRLDALERTPSVIIGREPTREDAKAYFAPEETHNRELRFAESSPFKAGRMSRETHSIFLYMNLRWSILETNMIY